METGELRIGTDKYHLTHMKQDLNAMFRGLKTFLSLNIIRRHILRLLTYLDMHSQNGFSMHLQQTIFQTPWFIAYLCVLN